MAKPKKSDIQSDLNSYHPRIRKVVEKAWAECSTVSTFRAERGFGPYLYPRTFANDMFDAIARAAITEFADDTSVHVETEPQTIKLIFKSKVLARFKKGDDDKLGQNAPTQAVLAFIDCDATFPGLPPETAKVEFIWLPNEFQTRLEHVLVVARDNNTLLWEYEIEPSESAAGGGTVVPFQPKPGKSAPEPDSKGLVKPKKKPDTKKKEEE